MRNGIDPWLRRSAAVFAVATAIHVLDHLRRGPESISEPLNAAGTIALVAQVTIITLILAGHPHRAIAAAAALPIAAGFVAAHWLPHWSELSDPVWEIHRLTWLSYVASTIEILAAGAVGVLGLMGVRARSLASL